MGRKVGVLTVTWGGVVSGHFSLPVTTRLGVILLAVVGKQIDRYRNLESYHVIAPAIAKPP